MLSESGSPDALAKSHSVDPLTAGAYEIAGQTVNPLPRDTNKFGSMTSLEEVFRRRINDLAPPFGSKTSLWSSDLTRWRKGERTNLRLATLEKVAEALGVDPAYLISDHVQKDGAPIPPPTLEAKGEDYEAVPLVHPSVAAGQARTSEDETGRWFMFRSSYLRRHDKRGEPGRLVCVRVTDQIGQGESMVPTIRPGAMLLVDRGPGLEGVRELHSGDDGKIYLVQDPDGGQMIKRVFHTGPRHLVLWSDNPVYKPMTVELDEDRRLQDVLKGRVRWVGQEEE